MTWADEATGYGPGMHRLGEADPEQVAEDQGAELLATAPDVDRALDRHRRTAAVDSAAITELQAIVDRLDLAERVAKRTLERSAEMLAERRGEPRGGSAVALHPTAIRNAADRVQRSRNEVADARAAADAHAVDLDRAREHVLLNPESEEPPAPEVVPEPVADEPVAPSFEYNPWAEQEPEPESQPEPQPEPEPEPEPELEAPVVEPADDEPSWDPQPQEDDDLFERWHSGTLEHDSVVEDPSDSGGSEDESRPFDVSDLYASDDTDRTPSPEPLADAVEGDSLPPWVSAMEDAAASEPEPEPEVEEAVAEPEPEPAAASTSDFDELFMDEAPTADLRQTRTLVLGVLVLSLGLSLALIGLELVDTWVGLAPVLLAAIWGSVKLRQSTSRESEVDEGAGHNPLLAEVMAATDEAYLQRRVALGLEDPSVLEEARAVHEAATEARVQSDAEEDGTSVPAHVDLGLGREPEPQSDLTTSFDPLVIPEDEPVVGATGDDDWKLGAYEPPSFEPPSYEPPSFEARPDPESVPEAPRRFEPIYDLAPDPEPERDPEPLVYEASPIVEPPAAEPVSIVDEAQREAAVAARRNLEDVERTGEVLAERLALAEEEVRVAERTWHELAGVDADPTDVDEVIRRVDPQHEDALLKATDTATARAATVLRERTLARWEEMWARVGLPVPPVEDAGRAVEDLTPADQVRLVCTDGAIDRASELSEALPAATVLVVERPAPEPEPEPEPAPVYEPRAFESPTYDSPAYQPPSFEAPSFESATDEYGAHEPGSDAESEPRRYTGFSSYLRQEGDPEDEEREEREGFAVDEDDEPPSFS